MTTVNVETRIIDTSPENLANNEEARQFQKESWPVRRESFKKTRKSETALNEISSEQWFQSLSYNNTIVLIDGTFAHSAAVHYAKKYIDYRNFREALVDKIETINYFSATSESDKINRFLYFIKGIEGFSVTVKNLPKASEEKNKNPIIYRSVAVDMAIVALREAYDRPDTNNVLIFSRDPEIIPLLKELKELNLTVTLVRCSEMATSRLILQEADAVIDIFEFFEWSNSYSETELKKLETNEDNL